MMTKSQIDYAAAATKLSAILGRKWNVNIVFGGNPATDGKNIFLPHWDFKNPKLRTALYGLIAHEAGGHVRQTDFRLLSSTIAERKKKPLFNEWRSIANILEDIRIEANLLRTYPGAATYLNAAVDVMLCGADQSTSASDVSSYWNLVLNWCLLIFRCDLLGQSAIHEQARDFDAVVSNVLPPSIVAEVRSIGLSVSKLSSRKSDYAVVQSYSDALLGLLESGLPSNQPQTTNEAQGQPSGDQSGSDGPQGGQEAQGQPSGDQSGSDGPQGGQEAQGQPSGDQSGSDNPQGGQEARKTLEENGVSKPIGDIFGELKTKGATKDPDIAATPLIGSSDAGAMTVQSSKAVMDRARYARPMIQGLTAALSPMLCGDMEYSSNRSTGNRINGRRISRALTDRDPVIFRKMVLDDDQSVAVQILLDRSSSTDGDVLIAETISALGIATALEQFSDVETAISFFPPDRTGSPIVTGAPFIKRFGSSVKSSFDRWPEADGTTPLAEAYQAAGFNFFHSEKERKILIVLTDGRPNCPVSALKQKQFLTSLGIEVYGVIISDKSYPIGMFDDSEQIQSPKELPRCISALVRRSL